MQALLIALVGRADGADIDVHGPLSACQLESTGEAALCGSIAAPERAEVAGAREISLRVVVLPARREPRRDPLVYLAGGPGASAVAAASWIGQSFAALRETRDILLVDLRGTGGSGALDCADRKGPAGVQQILDEFFPRRLVERCRDELATRADLAAYDTTAAVEDLERVRARLGYVELNLFGESYGTRVAQVYLARHPSSIRTITLMGTLALGEPLPAEMARDGQAALSAQFAACASDPDCARAFPDLSEDLARALDRLDRTPVMIPLNGAAPPSPGELRLTREGFAQLLRYLLYVPLTAADVPLIVHEAAAGDYATFAGWAARLAPFLTSVADGFFLSVTCSEDLPFVSSETLDRAGGPFSVICGRARSVGRAKSGPFDEPLRTFRLRSPATCPFSSSPGSAIR